MEVEVELEEVEFFDIDETAPVTFAIARCFCKSRARMGLAETWCCRLRAIRGREDSRGCEERLIEEDETDSVRGGCLPIDF